VCPRTAAGEALLTTDGDSTRRRLSTRVAAGARTRMMDLDIIFEPWQRHRRCPARTSSCGSNDRRWWITGRGPPQLVATDDDSRWPRSAPDRARGASSRTVADRQLVASAARRDRSWAWRAGSCVCSTGPTRRRHTRHQGVPSRRKLSSSTCRGGVGADGICAVAPPSHTGDSPMIVLPDDEGRHHRARPRCTVKSCWFGMG